MIDFYYLLRSMVYVQPFIWIYLLDKNIEIRNRYIRLLFPVGLGIIYYALVITGFEFSQYNNELLKFYVALMLYSYIVLRWEFNYKDTVCLTFLLVFINSYYWESMLHLNAIMFYRLSFNQFVQLFHLVPVYFLNRIIYITDYRRSKKLIIYGLMISTLNLLSIFVVPNMYRRLVNNITRISCLSILLIIFITMVEIKKKG